jgi:hypothetical protein
MRRIFLTAAASSALAFAAPGVALAHDGEHQQAEQQRGEHHQGEDRHGAHRRHHHHAHLMRFGAAGSSTTTPAHSSNETAGTVTSFANGSLTITLTDGSMVSGKVTDRTELECHAATPSAVTSDNGDQDRGDDNGVDGEENHGGPGPGRGDRHDNDNDVNDEAEHCTPAALVAGAVVREAVLSVSQFGAVWEKVELNR